MNIAARKKAENLSGVWPEFRFFLLRFLFVIRRFSGHLLSGFALFSTLVCIFPWQFFRFISTKPTFPSGQNSVLCRQRFRFFPAAFGVLQVPPFFLAGWEPYYIRLHPAKGLDALWTPGALGAALLTLHKGKSMKNKIPGGRYAANHLITLRVTPEEKDWLMERVAIIGISQSAYVRNRIFGGRPILPRADEAAIRELRRMGGLIKHNFETLRQAKMGADFIRLHEKLLLAIISKIEELGSRQNDCEEDQESEDAEAKNETDR